MKLIWSSICINLFVHFNFKGNFRYTNFLVNKNWNLKFSFTPCKSRNEEASWDINIWNKFKQTFLLELSIRWFGWHPAITEYAWHPTYIISEKWFTHYQILFELLHECACLDTPRLTPHRLRTTYKNKPANATLGTNIKFFKLYFW